MTIRVVKFGGSSLADATRVRQAIEIIKAEPSRTVVVVSAPGKRDPADTKVTDLLYQWYRGLGHEGDQTFDAGTRITERYKEICSGLSVSLDMRAEFDLVFKHATEGAGEDYAASRGEYWMAKIMAQALDYEFVDAAQIIRFNSVKTDKGHLATNDKLYNKAITHSLVHEALGGKRAVVPGFYGTLLDNKTIKTFDRNSSDISGAIIAAALGATLYEKFTDVPGILAADNRLVDDPSSIASATYRELGELAVDTTGVFHPEAMYPVQEAGVKTLILNSNDPSAPGTIIYPDVGAPDLPPGTVIGIAARSGFSAITVYKAAMNREIGFMRRVLQVFEDKKISFEHAPMGRDIVSIILQSSYLTDREEEKVKEALYTVSLADEVKVEHGLALISTVGRAMRDTAGTAARLFGALARKGISSHIIDQGATEMNIVVGVAEKDLKEAVNAIYREFFECKNKG